MNTDKLMNEVVRTGESASKIVNSKIRTLTKVKIPAIHLYLFNKLFNVYVSASAMTDILKYDGANGKCYIASMAIILAMEPNDLVIKGNLAPEHKDGWPHQWVEFVFNDKWYVLDSSFVGVYEKEDYYNTFKPAILSKKSNAEWMEDDFAKNMLK